MKILVDNGSYHLRNYGDIAMLQVAVERLHRLWPSALIQVITDAPELLAKYCPNVYPLSSHGRDICFKNQDLFGGIRKFIPRRVYSQLLRFDETLRIRNPLLAQRWIRWRMKNPGIDNEDINAFFKTLFEADLVITSGGGYITDAFGGHSAKVLSLLGMAIQVGKPTAMFGQGLGPMHSRKLLAWAKPVLPSVDLIALRENRVGPALLDLLGVAPTRMVTTGDDAIELVYQKRTRELGTGIGVNLRVAPYSGAGRDHINTVRAALQDAAIKYNAPLIPLPISLVDAESDTKTIRQILAGYDDTSDGGQSLDNPFKVIEQAGRCRVVVTGSYHPAVFALAQGIPVVGLAKSTYYIDKFLGLADQFGTGCEVVSLDDKQLPEKLKVGIDIAWRSAEQVRPQLLEAARQQIKLSRTAFRRIYDLVSAHEAVT